MPDRARYDGPSDEVRVTINGDKVGEERFVNVKRGGLLPTEDEDGNPIPASVRDNLLEQPDWSKVSQSTSSKKEG